MYTPVKQGEAALRNANALSVPGPPYSYKGLAPLLLFCLLSSSSSLSSPFLSSIYLFSLFSPF
jgi:hypothetical protein